MLSPLILLATREEVFRRSVESVVSQAGYRVASASDEARALLQARSRRPDGVIVDASIAPPPHFAFCRTLRIDAGLSAATPIIITSLGSVTRADQLAALRAGAWELRGQPLDFEELLLRLGLYVSGKLDADQAGAEGLLDRASGLYNTAGVLRRSEELAALSVRQKLPLSCVVFRVPERDIAASDGDRVAGAFKSEGRVSDAIGRTGPNEFTVFAPATDGAAVVRLVNRLGDTVARRARLDHPMQSGSASATEATGLDPRDLLERARRSLDAT
ncbi:MAG TPA: hypothetical protein VH439_02245 [Gemmatimonadales bacterium]|jgi:PleD family two-component response regulator